jgi:hypothetical protein
LENYEEVEERVGVKCHEWVIVGELERVYFREMEIGSVFLSFERLDVVSNRPP